MAAPSTQPKNFAGGVMRLSDGTGTPVTHTVPMTKGDFTLSPIQARLNEQKIATARTQVLGVMIGAPIIPKLSLSCMVGNVVGSSAVAPGSTLEMVTGKGAYSANISTMGTNREMTVDTRLTIEGTQWGDANDETIDCLDCLFSSEFAESADGNTLSFTAQVLGDIVVTNGSNVVTFSWLA